MTENTNIPTPYFSVGEEVILESINQPEYNGEYTIQDRRYGKFPCADGSVNIGWDYDLGFKAKYNNIEYRWWREPALRKKYPPSEMSFSEMIESFNKENVEAI